MNLRLWFHPSPTLPIKGRVLPFLGNFPTHKASTSPLVGDLQAVPASPERKGPVDPYERSKGRGDSAKAEAYAIAL